jgi:hypothetical protein
MGNFSTKRNIVSILKDIQSLVSKKQQKPKDLLREYGKIVNGKLNLPPTPQQYYIIRRIQYSIGVKFKGKTFSEAQEFINKNIIKSKGDCS